MMNNKIYVGLTRGRALVFMILMTVAAVFEAQAVMPWQVRWHNEAADTTKITRLLIEGQKTGLQKGDLVGWFGEQFIDTPYVSGTLESEDGKEWLTVNLDQLDCTTLVENVLALTLTIGEGRTAWQDYLHNLESVRYRQGEMDGYGSRLHYISDWIVDNSHRGNFKEATDRVPGIGYTVKTLDFMTKHRDKYAALADSATFERIKNTEIGYRSHRFPYVKSGALMGRAPSKWLKHGDIVTFTTKVSGLDVSHVGIIVMENGEARLLHASTKAGKVVMEKGQLGEYFKKNPSLTGLRIIRMEDR